jgi:beta-mannanase
VFVDGTFVSTTSGTSFTATGLTCGRSYLLAIGSFDAAGNRSASASTTGATTPCGDTSAPTTPAGLDVASVTSTSVTVTWSASTDDVGVGGYGFYVGGAPAGSTTSTSYTASGLSCGTGYSVAVDAFDAAGNRSTKASVTATTAACAPTTSSSSSSIYWGAYIEGTQTYSYLYGGSWGNVPWDATTWNRFESNARKKVSIEHYGQPAPWEQAFAAGTANLVTSRGAIPLMDMSSKSVSLPDLANGAYDSSLTTWADAVKTWGKPFFLRWDWEMNGSWFPWGAQAAQNPGSFVAAWRHFHDVADRVGASNITWVWCPNLEYSGSTAYEQLYPGDSYVDWTCLDGYNKNSTSVGFANLYGQSYNHLLKIAPTKPIMIGEVGSKEYATGVKASWVNDMLSTQLPQYFPQVKAVVWFNWRISENGTWWDWPIESSSATQSAFADAVASPYYAPGGSFGAPPLLSKVKPL